ncbi:MAG: 5-bromo-4-chloroindolyl phosphate hydrolysis family protein [Neomegalonema sp.]|nr:5-bromo-4-chloroindolyl phosphate hydrolysis family protein [Neomegalonema sp.]
MNAPEQNKQKADADGGWRNAENFRQGERYGAPNETTNGQPQRASLKPVILGGFAMLATTALLSLLRVPPLFAFVGGAVVFLGVVYLTRKDGDAPARKVSDAAGANAAAVQEKLDRAEAELAAIDTTRQQLPGEITRDLGEMTSAARKVLDQIAKDPLDLDRARKFLIAYIPSARKAVEKFAALGVRDPELDARFRSLVAEMTETCRRQEETLRSDDVFDLEVEMDTLSERLRAET